MHYQNGCKILKPVSVSKFVELLWSVSSAMVLFELLFVRNKDGEGKCDSVIYLQRVLTPDDPMEGYEDPVYDETLLEKIPEEFRDFTLEKLVHNRIEVENFKLFLAENYASMDLLCWMDIEHFRRMPQTDEKKRDEKAKEIKNKYLNKKYFFGPNSPAGKEGQDKVSLTLCILYTSTATLTIVLLHEPEYGKS